MNTKQILYNALKSQLDAKKADCDKYDEEVVTIAHNQLVDKVSNWFKTNTEMTSTAVFSGEKIEFEYGSWNRRIDVHIRNSWDGSNTRYTELSWNSGTYKTSEIDSVYLRYLKDLSIIANNLPIVETQLLDWRKEYKQIESDRAQFCTEYIDLKRALDNLSTEINRDTRETMKEIGFEIKSFKSDVTLNWDYKNSEKAYFIDTRKHNERLQFGRSQYDTIMVNGYKVLGKKGNKYKLEVHRDGANAPQIYEVLEKKFEMFVDSVNDWENRSADARKAKTEREYAERTQKAA
jgi:ribosomal protein L23